MNGKILFRILILDTLIGCLTWKDRIRIHLFLNSKIADLSPKIIEVYKWIKTNNWLPPEVNYGQDRLQYFSYEDYTKFYPVEDYLLHHPELKSELQALKV